MVRSATMNEESFLSKRKADWVHLMELCDRADRSPTDLTKEQLLDLFRLYRRTSTDLAVARTISTSPSLIGYLNDLTCRAYSVVYRQPREAFWSVVYNSVVLAAQTVRRRKAFIFISAGLFFLSAISVFCLCRYSSSMHELFVPKAFAGVFDQWKSGKFEERTGSESAAAWSNYASHNPTVAIVSGAVGAGTFGVLSLYLILQNGALLGSLASELIPVHRLDFLLSSIFPHGVPEISGLIISGACGLLLGWALINPGKLTRGESLRQVGKDAITLLGTSVCMMFIAAPIEGFFSFNPHVPGWCKTLVGAISLTFWLIFWSSFGKATQPERNREDWI
jgi:uncharacterized membrane protein SpoIIM required for sporulation